MATNKKNLAAGIIYNNPGTTGTIITLEAGYGATMPIPPFHITVTPPGQLSTMGNSEILLVTNISSEDLTVVRAQKGTTAQDISAGWSLANGIYNDDILSPKQVDWQMFKVEKTSTQATGTSGSFLLMSWQDKVEFNGTDNFNLSANYWVAPSDGWLEGSITMNIEGGTGNDDTMNWGLSLNNSWKSMVNDNWRFFSRGGIEYPSTQTYAFPVSAGDVVRANFSGCSYSINMLSTSRWVGRFYPYS